MFVVAADELGVAARDGVAVEGDQGIVGGAPGEFLADLVANLNEGLEDLEFDVGPVGLGLAALVFDADTTGLIAGVGDLGAELRRLDELFDVAEAIGPLCEIVSGERGGIAAGGILGATRA